jgi:hypothetical protein
MSKLEERFELQLRCLRALTPGIMSFKREYPFAVGLGRKWRFDFAWLKQRIAVELEGGTSLPGRRSRHTSGKGFREDCHKYNAAAIMGWTLLRGDAEMVETGQLASYVEDMLNGKAIPTLRRDPELRRYRMYPG